MVSDAIFLTPKKGGAVFSIHLFNSIPFQFPKEERQNELNQ